jgi:hypothetical protein
MRLTSFLFSSKSVVIAILAFWFISTVSLWIFQSKVLLGLGDTANQTAHPEIPGNNPDAVLSIIEACNVEASKEDRLIIPYNGSDSVQLFLAYRLAYKLYPRKVVAQNYSNDDLQTAIKKLEDPHQPTLLLVLSVAGFAPPPGSQIKARLPLDSLLIRLAEEGKQ